MRELLVILFFSHHAPEQHDHCLFLPLPGGRRLPLCARCLGIYPMMLIVLALQLGPFQSSGASGPAAGSGAGRLDLAWTDPWLMILLPLPTVIEFLLEQTGRIHGSNRLRILAGLPLGVAMGRMFLRYLLDPFDPVFWAIVAGYGGTCGLTAAFALRRRFASGRDP